MKNQCNNFPKLYKLNYLEKLNKKTETNHMKTVGARAKNRPRTKKW